MGNTAKGTPTKEFFVGMLTRDIELSDAILDLLDNCLDGVVRQKGKDSDRAASDYYVGYYSNITFDSISFNIEDNCGGIPRNVAEEYAFRMGRSSEKDDDGLPTVGIYGIGMKRAIFKIGQSAEISTRNQTNLYKVSIPITWVSSDVWDFSIEDITEDILNGGGTRIAISNLTPNIADSWATKDKIDEYTKKLIKAVRQSYSFIIQKGFKITINSKEVAPLPIQLLLSDQEAGIKPFLYSQTYDDVNVSLAVGFYAPPPSPEDIDDENDLKRSSSDAGWTVVCNDRVVLYNDKSHLTGWGEAGVPQYHTQFIGIRGIVIFESHNPKNLPMTTTKRGVDTSSKIYSAVKDKMRIGLKMFTDYTNKWKGQNEKERDYSTKAKSVDIDRLIGTREKIEAEIPTIQFKKNREGFIFNPTLPKPPNDKPYKVIRFSKSIDDISLLKEHFYGDSTHSASPSQVGEKCFDVALANIKGEEEE